VREDDRRVMRTRRMLHQALLELMDEKDYERITIRDLTDRADIGYATFFRHYQGIDELMLEIFAGIIDDLEAQALQAGADYYEREGRLMFESAARSPSLYRAVLRSRAFSRKLQNHVQGMMLSHLRSHGAQGEAVPIPVEIAALHMVSSLLALVDWWLAHGMQPSVDRMAAIYERLIIRSTWQALTPGLKLRLPWESGG
jgi:AcrR family transcriptional regulator